MDATLGNSDRDRWRWRAKIMQLPPIDEALVDEAIAVAREKKELPALAGARYQRWAEGPSAPILHVGPYGTEQASTVALRQAIAAQSMRPRGRHHEIYLGDPCTAQPERLRTILRQPVEPVA